VCISKVPSLKELLSTTFSNEASAPLEPTATVSAIVSAIVPEDTKDTGRSANETCFTGAFPQESCCLANFPGAERPFTFPGLLELFQLTPKSSGSVPRSWNWWKKQIVRKEIAKKQVDTKRERPNRL
jgi:hypothetical protein